jgi:hypothetical protein
VTDDKYLAYLLKGAEDAIVASPDEPRYVGEVRGLKCPDCKVHDLCLRTSKHGVFYGCSSFFDTGCKGSHGADANGHPCGIPAPAATRALRQQAMLMYERVKKQVGISPALTIYNDVTRTPISMLDEDTSRRLVHAMQYALGERSVWRRLLEDD